MTRDQALNIAPLWPGVPDMRCATGTDGERWYETQRNVARQEDRTWEILWHGRGVYGIETEADPPGVDWAPGRVKPPEGALPVTDPAEWRARRGLRAAPRKPSVAGRAED